MYLSASASISGVTMSERPVVWSFWGLREYQFVFLLSLVPGRRRYGYGCSGNSVSRNVWDRNAGKVEIYITFQTIEQGSYAFMNSEQTDESKAVEGIQWNSTANHYHSPYWGKEWLMDRRRWSSSCGSELYYRRYNPLHSHTPPTSTLKIRPSQRQHIKLADLQQLQNWKNIDILKTCERRYENIPSRSFYTFRQQDR